VPAIARPGSGYGHVLQAVPSMMQPPGWVGESHPGLQVSVTQFAVAQLTWHEHARPQSRLRHAWLPAQLALHDPAPQVKSRQDPVPEHSRSQEPAPQRMFLQLCEPLHVIEHALLVVQSTPLLQALLVEHAMSQLQPVGHVICWSHAPLLAAQSILQLFVVVLHDVHCDGHEPPIWPPSGGSTQNPSVQTRFAAHCAWVWHAKSSL
jgi:hypothetical protein